MIRRSRLDDEEKVDRWLVSYADFITLLFAFFVVMYSISQVNQGKYKILSESLLSAFESPERSMRPIQAGSINRTDDPVSGDVLDTPGSQPEVQEPQEDENYASFEEFNRIQKQLESSLSELIKQDLVNINSNKNWLEIDLRSALLFESGSDRLERNARVVIEEIADSLRNNSHKISVRGHTDNIPIDTDRFLSNWELSSSRAVAVVRLLQKLDLNPKRLTAEGHGEYQPVATNETSDGRAKNRRVTIAISRYTLESSGDQGAAVSADVNTEEPKVTVPPEQTEKAVPAQSEESKEQKYEIIRLPEGGLLIRGKKLPREKKESDQSDN